jgi:tetratricopeptide (TPR) repeat protein
MLRQRASVLGAVAMFLVAAAPAARAAEVSGKAIYKKCLMGSVLVRTPDGGGGTGGLFDRANRLVVTNYHVVGQHEKVLVNFPEHKNGKLIAEKAHYLGRTARTVEARVVAVYPTRDLAVIQLESLPEGAVELKLAGDDPEPGERVHSIGNPSASQANWVYTPGVVRQVVPSSGRLGGPGLKKPIFLRSTRVVEMNAAINHGNSGGPVVNDRGEVVGVVSFMRDQYFGTTVHLISGAIAVSEVKASLAEARRLMNPTTAEEFIRRGQRGLEVGWADRAAEDFTRALKLCPFEADALEGRARAWLLKGDLAKALADCEDALALAAERASAYELRGRLHALKRQYDKAVADLDKAIELAPKAAEYHVERGRTLLEAGDARKALAGLTEATKLDKGNAEAWMWRGVACFRLKDYGAANTAYVESRKYDPTNPEVCYHLAILAVAVKQDKDAVKFYTLALELGHPQPALVRTERAGAYARQGRHDEALDDLKAAVNSDPKFVPAYCLAAELFERQGNDELSQRLYARALELEPGLSRVIKRHEAKRIQVVNNTGQTLKVYLQYEGKDADGKWAWLPGKPGPGGKVMVFRVAPGEKVILRHGGKELEARRVRAWALAPASGDRWGLSRGKDLWLVPGGKGYLSAGPTPATFTLPVNPRETRTGVVQDAPSGGKSLAKSSS